MGVAEAFVPVVLLVACGGGTVRRLYRRSLSNAADLKAAVDERDELLSLLLQNFRAHLSTLKLNQGILRILMQSAAPEVDEGLARRFDAADLAFSGLTSLIDNVVEVSKSKGRRRIINREQFDLSDLARQIADSLRPQAEAANCALNVDLQPAVGRWDRFQLERAMLRLLANAIKAAPGSEITLHTESDHGRAKLVVEDHAAGSSDDKVRILFQAPGHDQYVAQDAEAGLALYIARKIVDAWGENRRSKSHW